MTTETKLYGGDVLVRFNDDTHIYTANGKRKSGVTTICGVLDKSMALIPWAVGLAVDFIKENRDLLDSADAEDIFEAAEERSEEEKNKAADLGSKIHEWVENDVKGEHPPMPEDERVVRGVMAWMDWRDKHHAEIVHSERPVYSKKHDYIGTLDFVAKIISCGGACCGNHEYGKVLLVMGDIKTGNGIYTSMGMQTAAYAQAYSEELGTKFDGRVIVRLAKEDEDHYNARITKKNERRERKKKSMIPLDYQVFEAVYLDMDEAYQEDIKAFNSAIDLYKWQYPAKKRLEAAQLR